MDGRLARGAETRRVTLRRAADIASVEGLDGLTIGRLASELELSKSGIFAHFGSKEDLQLATLGYAQEVFIDRVIRPARTAEPGLPRLRALVDNWITYSRTRIFPGGCFFAAASAEFDAREGRVHDAVVGAFRSWMATLVGMVEAAIERGQLPANTDAAQLAFEIDALARASNAVSVLTGDDEAYRRAEAGIRAKLG